MATELGTIATHPALKPIAAALPGGGMAIPVKAPANEAAAAGIQQLTNAVNQANQSKRASLVDRMPYPTQVTFTVDNVTGAAAATITAYCFNEDYLNATPTDNGSGAGSVIKTYSDGFSGNLLNHIIEMYGTEGLPISQLQLLVEDNATGTQDKAALNQVNPQRSFYNGDGSTQSDFIPISSTGNPIYNQQGFLIINQNFRIRRNEQLRFTVPVGKTMSVILVMPAQA